MEKNSFFHSFQAQHMQQQQQQQQQQQAGYILHNLNQSLGNNNNSNINSHAFPFSATTTSVLPNNFLSNPPSTTSILSNTTKPNQLPGLVANAHPQQQQLHNLVQIQLLAQQQQQQQQQQQSQALRIPYQIALASSIFQPTNDPKANTEMLMNSNILSNQINPALNNSLLMNSMQRINKQQQQPFLHHQHQQPLNQNPSVKSSFAFEYPVQSNPALLSKVPDNILQAQDHARRLSLTSILGSSFPSTQSHTLVPHKFQQTEVKSISTFASGSNKTKSNTGDKEISYKRLSHTLSESSDVDDSRPLKQSSPIPQVSVSSPHSTEHTLTQNQQQQLQQLPQSRPSSSQTDNQSIKDAPTDTSSSQQQQQRSSNSSLLQEFSKPQQVKKARRTSNASSQASKDDEANPRQAIKHKRASSKYRGVYFNRLSNSWRARIWLGGTSENIGSFATEEEAARAFDRRAIELRGPHAIINFPHLFDELKGEAISLKRDRQTLPLRSSKRLRSMAFQNSTCDNADDNNNNNNNNDDVDDDDGSSIVSSDQEAHVITEGSSDLEHDETVPAPLASVASSDNIVNPNQSTSSI